MNKLYDKITQDSLDKFDSMFYSAHYADTPTQVKAIVAKAVQSDAGVKQLMRLMYDPLIKYNIRIDPLLYQFVPEDIIERSGDVNTLLGILIELHTKGKNMSAKDKKSMVEWYIANQTPHIAYFLRKTLDCGFAIKGAKSLGIIPQHSPQKGVLLKDMSKLKYPCIADFKYNGSRLTIVVDANGAVECRLLQGQVISIPTLEQQIHSLDLRDITLDGELIKARTDEGSVFADVQGGITEADRIWVSGKITSATSTKSALSMAGMRYVVYDYLPMGEAMDKAVRIMTGYLDRRAYINELFTNSLVNSSVMVKGVAWQVSSVEDLEYLAKTVKAMGGEGLMVKGLHSTYDHKKNNQWYKIKNIQECDLEIIDYKLHSRNSNWIGSLLCEGTIEGEQVRVWVGGGLNESDRPITKFPEYKNGIVMVVYMDIVRSKGKVASLSNPRIVKDKVERPLIDVLRFDSNSINF